MTALEKVRARNKTSSKLKKRGIYRDYDFKRKIIILYIFSETVNSYKEVGYMTECGEAVMY